MRVHWRLQKKPSFIRRRLVLKLPLPERVVDSVVIRAVISNDTTIPIEKGNGKTDPWGKGSPYKILPRL